MKLKKSLLVAGAVTTMGLAGISGSGLVSAATASSTNDSLITKIAQKFNLKEDDVKAVFDEDKTAREAERTADMSKQLQTAVDNGKITAAQKTLIETKQKEQQTARQTEQTALETWAKQQGIDLKYVMMGGGPNGNNSNHLQTAVDNGDITADQKKLIEAKQAELKTTRDAARDALKQWATDNNIDEQYLMMGMGHGPGGPGGPGGR